MKSYTIGLEFWVEVEAEDEQEALGILIERMNSNEFDVPNNLEVAYLKESE